MVPIGPTEMRFRRAETDASPRRPTLRTSLATLTEDLVVGVLAALRSSSAAKIAELADRPHGISATHPTPRAALPDVRAVGDLDERSEKKERPRKPRDAVESPFRLR